MPQSTWSNINDPKAIDGGDYFDFRKANFNYLYFCPACSRSFETRESSNECIYCKSTGLRELTAKRKVKESKEKYRYYCTKCERTFTTQEKVNVCQFCGYVNIHYYPWRVVGFFDKIFLKLMGLARLSKKLPVHRVDIKEKDDQAVRRILSRLRQTNTPRINFSPPNINFRFSLFPRKKEELPTR